VLKECLANEPERRTLDLLLEVTGPKETMPLVMAIITNPKYQERCYAFIDLLGQMGTNAVEAVPFLEEKLAGATDPTRQKIETALRRIRREKE